MKTLILWKVSVYFHVKAVGFHTYFVIYFLVAETVANVLLYGYQDVFALSISRQFSCIMPLETVKIVTFYHSATSVLLNVLLLTGVFLRYNIVT